MGLSVLLSLSLLLRNPSRTYFKLSLEPKLLNRCRLRELNQFSLSFSLARLDLSLSVSVAWVTSPLSSSSSSSSSVSATLRGGKISLLVRAPSLAAAGADLWLPE